MRYEITKIGGLECVVRYPKDYTEKEKHPVILLLHGAGSRGNDISVLRNNPYFLITEKHTDFPFITIAPLCNKDSWFELMHKLEIIVCEIKNMNCVDAERLYAMGASMGGYAVWQLTMNLPNAFAAIIPICGGGMYWNSKRLTGTAVWAFHGDSDKVVFTEESVKMVNRINEDGGNAKLTIYKDTGHDSWVATYSDYNVFRWLLEHKNDYTEDSIKSFDDAELYG